MVLIEKNGKTYGCCLGLFSANIFCRGPNLTLLYIQYSSKYDLRKDHGLSKQKILIRFKNFEIHQCYQKYQRNLQFYTAIGKWRLKTNIKKLKLFPEKGRNGALKSWVCIHAKMLVEGSAYAPLKTKSLCINYLIHVHFKINVDKRG